LTLRRVHYHGARHWLALFVAQGSGHFPKIVSTGINTATIDVWRRNLAEPVERLLATGVSAIFYRLGVLLCAVDGPGTLEESAREPEHQRSMIDEDSILSL
jgi:hypothetical protein